jgi:hypothetical protein
MASVTITGAGSQLPTPLQNILAAENVQPGSPASYELCKLLYEFHPLAGKIIEKPVALALNKARKIDIPGPFEEQLREAFEHEWSSLGATDRIRDTLHLSRVYGASAIVYGGYIGGKGVPTDQPIDPWKLAELENIYFNQLDPLNLAGSIVTNQNPNSPDFMKSWQNLTAAGQPYHQSRGRLIFCGTPIYLSFQGSSFSFAGRSLFLRALFPLKSYIQTMTVNDMVSLKAGLIVAKIKQPTSIVNKIMGQAFSAKRTLVQEGQTYNVLSIQPDEDIESINLENTDKAMTTARDNIIADVAAATDVPGLLLKDEAFTNGFGEGKEDSKQVALYVDGIRTQAAPLIEYFDNIVQHRAWNKDFYTGLANEFPEQVGTLTYEQFFYAAQKRFKAVWPSLLEEPESDRVKRDSDKVKSMSDLVKTLAPILDPENKARLVGWLSDNLSAMTEMFQAPLEIDLETLAAYEPPAPASPFGPQGGNNGDSEGASARADAEHWVTLHGGKNNEGEHTGTPVLINGAGEIIGGAGGKLTGKRLEHVKSKSKDVEKPGGGGTETKGPEGGNGQHQPAPKPPPEPPAPEQPKETEQERERRIYDHRMAVGQAITAEFERMVSTVPASIARERVAQLMENYVDKMVESGMDREEAKARAKNFGASLNYKITERVQQSEAKHKEIMTEAKRYFYTAFNGLLSFEENIKAQGLDEWLKNRLMKDQGLTDYEAESHINDLIRTMKQERAEQLSEAGQRRIREAQEREQRAAETKTRLTQPLKPYVHQKTTKDIERVVHENGYAQVVKFGKLDPKVANVQVQSLVETLNRFPALRSTQKWVGSMQERCKSINESKLKRALDNGALEIYKRIYPDKSEAELMAELKKSINPERAMGRAYAYSVNHPGHEWEGVFTHEKWGKDFEKMSASMASCVESKFHPVGCTTVKSIMDHEYGHQIDHHLGVRNHPELRSLYSHYMKLGIKEHLSTYGGKNIAEFIAESWAEYVNNPQPRECASQVGKLIERIYRDKYGGGES